MSILNNALAPQQRIPLCNTAQITTFVVTQALRYICHQNCGSVRLWLCRTFACFGSVHGILCACAYLNGNGKVRDIPQRLCLAPFPKGMDSLVF